MAHDKFRVIIVDDDEVLAEVLSLYLSDTFDVKAFTNPTEALAFMDHKRIDAAILDFYLDGLDGWEVLKDLRLNHSHVPVLFLSGDSKVKVKIKNSRDNLLDFISKPVQGQELLFRLYNLINENERFYGSSHSL